MSLLPCFRATLKKDLSDEQCEKLVADVKAIKGVLSVAFNQDAQGGKTLRVTHNGGGFVQDKVGKMDGVVRTHYQF